MTKAVLFLVQIYATSYRNIKLHILTGNKQTSTIVLGLKINNFN